MDRSLIASLALIMYGTFQEDVVAKPPLRIINGTTADDGEFPYMVQVLGNDFYKCGGSILSPDWILTSASCIIESYNYSIVYGSNMLYNYPNTTIEAKNTFQHPNYTYTPEDIPIYDVGLIELVEPISLSAIAQPIQLAEENEDIPVGVDGVLTGWGCVDGTWGTMDLQKIILQILSDEECVEIINNYTGNDSFIPIYHLCTDDDHNGECYGDTGGPFVINDTQYAISSWTIIPGLLPGAFSRITNPEYRGWIKNITGI